MGSNGKNWLLNPESSSQSEDYSRLVWLVVREPLSDSDKVNDQNWFADILTRYRCSSRH